MLEYSCKDIVFHFNKKHLEDPSVPMWVLKTQGETFYVSHVDCRVPWSTKETPDNPHTKGSIKIKGCLLKIDDDNVATITKLTNVDKMRLHNQRLGITRVVVSAHKDGYFKLTEALKKQNIRHMPIKKLIGTCKTTFYITDIVEPKYMPFLSITLGETDFRVLMPNELYDNPDYVEKTEIDLDEVDYDKVDT